MEIDQNEESRQLTELPAAPASRQSVDIKAMFQMGFPVEQQKQVLDEYTERNDQFRAWLRERFTEGVHYGFPPGTLPKRKTINGVPHFAMWSRGGEQWVPETQWKHKPSLYKAGAQLLVDLFQLKATFNMSIDAWKMFGGRAGDVVIECHLCKLCDGEQVGHGIGAATRQKPDNDYDGKNMNSAVKMASKRALTGAVLECFGLSDLFTQDVEDAKAPETEVQNPKPVANAPEVAPREGGSDPGPRRKPGKVSIDEVRLLYSRWQKSVGAEHAELPPEARIAQFAIWAQDVTGDTFTDVVVPDEWTREAYSAATSVLP